MEEKELIVSVVKVKLNHERMPRLKRKVKNASKDVQIDYSLMRVSDVIQSYNVYNYIQADGLEDMWNHTPYQFDKADMHCLIAYVGENQEGILFLDNSDDRLWREAAYVFKKPSVEGSVVTK